MRARHVLAIAFLLPACDPGGGSSGGDDPARDARTGRSDGGDLDAARVDSGGGCANGERRCNGREVELCRDASWTPSLFCPAGTDCVAGMCEEVACEADCAGRTCGSDGCGDACGDGCEAGWTCNGSGRCDPPAARCGDDACNGDETCGTCPADCGSCCGDGECGGDESCATCPADCTCAGGDVCNALTRMCDACEPQCDGRECGPDGCGATCADGCAGGVACVNGLCLDPCEPACEGRACGPDGCGATCGDGCEGADVCNLEGACQERPARCGDEVCDDGEDCATCPADCGACCGDGVCAMARDESCATCPADCACGNGEGCNIQLRRCVVRCVPQCGGRDCGDDGCGGSCGGCDADEDCQAGVCRDECVRACGGRACGGDGCDGRCGECDVGELCDDGVCEAACVAQCDGRNCGDDGCQGVCGECDGDQLCNQGVCDDVCQPDCDGRECGGDGCGEVCGECEAGECVDGQCCVASCEGVECGDDGCGGECGPCDGDDVCDDGACCARDCEGRACGDDGCGDVCGECEGRADVCRDGACCSPDCDGRACGADGCGDACGACDDEERCDGAGRCVPVGRFCDCEGADVCVDGFCRAPVDLCSGDNPNGLCPGGRACRAGECVNQGAACSPQNPTGLCELGQVCRNGECEPFDGAALCDDQNGCTVDRFDHLANRCVNEVAGGLMCDDGNGCTRDHCQAGACVSERMAGCIEPPQIDPYVTPTNVGDLDLAGSKPAGASVRINGMEAVPESPEARWSVMLNLQPGENVYRVTSVDAGQESAEVVVRIDYDVDPPSTRVTPGGGIYLDGITVTVTSDEPATVYYTDDGGTPDQWSRSLRSVRQFRIFDDTTLRFRARDVAGNWEADVVEAAFEITGDGNRWREGPALPEGLTLMGATLVGSRVVLAGGTDGLASQAGVHTYDFGTGEWGLEQALPVARAQLALVTHGNDVYAIGGEDDGLPLNINRRLTLGGQWMNRAPMPSTRFGLAAATVGDRIYAFGGKTNGGLVLDRLEVYDPVANNWSNDFVQMPRARYGHVSIAYDGRIYLFGGEDGDGNPIAEVDVYVPGNDAWDRIDDLPTPRSFPTVTLNRNAGAVAEAYAGLVVAGGRVGGGAATTVVEEYVVAAGHWRQRTPLGVPRHSGAAVTRVGGPGDIDSLQYRGFVFGGLRGGVVSADSRYYTQALDYARHLTPMPAGRFMHAAQEQDGRVYLFGGRTFAETRLVWAFDPETGHYDELPELPTVQNGLGSAAHGGLLYAVGGANAFGIALPTLRSFDPSVREWSDALELMPTGRRDAAVAVLDGELWVVGGDNNGALQAVEVYDIEADAWRAGPVLPEGRTGARAVVHDGELLVVGGIRPNGALHSDVLGLRGGQWVVALAGVTVAYANVALVDDHQLNIFGGQGAAGPSNDIWSVDLANNVLSRPLEPATNLLTAVDFAATTTLNGSVYIFGGNDDAPVGPEGLSRVQKLNARCFNGKRDGREVAAPFAPYDVGGGCASEVPLRDGDARLVPQRLGQQGRLEVLHDGSWRGICDDGWDDVESRVACREIFGAGHTGSFRSCNGPNDLFWMDDVQCDGDEVHITDCRHRGWGSHNCGRSETVCLTCRAE